MYMSIFFFYWLNRCIRFLKHRFITRLSDFLLSWIHFPLRFEYLLFAVPLLFFLAAFIVIGMSISGEGNNRRIKTSFSKLVSQQYELRKEDPRHHQDIDDTNIHTSITELLLIKPTPIPHLSPLPDVPISSFHSHADSKIMNLKHTISTLDKRTELDQSIRQMLVQKRIQGIKDNSLVKEKLTENVFLNCPIDKIRGLSYLMVVQICSQLLNSQSNQIVDINTNKTSEDKKYNNINFNKKDDVNSKRFVCSFSKESIPLGYLNDDYCDCIDGSDEPGTSACSDGKFYCFHQQLKQQQQQLFNYHPLHSSRVNDGICDCCDGSDEWKTNICFNDNQTKNHINISTQLQAECEKRGGET